MKIARIQDYIFLHILFLLYAIVTVIQKIASKVPSLSIRFMFLWSLVLVLFVIYAFLWQRALSKFSLVEAYSNKGIVLIWTLLFSKTIFAESIKFSHIIGVVLIIIGIVWVSKEYE